MSKKINKTPNEPPQNGTEITRYSNGNIKFKTSYINGKIHGLRIYWRENGAKCWEATAKEGELHGVYTARRENGQKEYEIYHNHNQEYACIEYNERKPVTRAHFSIPNTHNHNQGKQKLKGKSY